MSGADWIAARDESVPEGVAHLLTTVPDWFDRRVLDKGLSEGPYTLDVFTSKVQFGFDHVLTAYGDDGESDYSPRDDLQFQSPGNVVYAGPHGVTRSQMTSFPSSTTTRPSPLRSRHS